MSSSRTRSRYLLLLAANLCLGSGYGVVDDGFGSHAIIYKESALTLQGFGLEQIWEEDQWGAVSIYKQLDFLQRGIVEVLALSLCI